MKKYLIVLLVANLANGEEVKDWYQPTPELINLGKNTFQSMCISCHGENGKADNAMGQAVKARNFTAPRSEWKFGTKVTGIFSTLTKGSPGTAMTAYESIPVKTRFAIAHYIRDAFVTADSKEETDSDDYAKIAKEFDFANIEKFEKIPFEAALKMMAVELPTPQQKNIAVPESMNRGHQLFQNRCASCHGVTGEGTLASFEKIEVQTPENSVRALGKSQGWYGNFAKFTKLVGEGRPGTLKPPQADLSPVQFDNLYQYVKFLADN